MVAFTIEASLSARQLEVLTLLADGHDSAQIARRMKLAASTVKAYRGQLLMVLQARSSAHAVHRAHCLGILSPG